MIPFRPKRAAMVFDSWASLPDRPGDVGLIRCCDRTVVMRNGRIICEVCDTIVETGRGPGGDHWQIVRVKGVDV